MKQRVLVSSILMGLAAGLACAHAFAQTADASAADGAKKKETTELGGVVVTGSLIPQAQNETASPTIQISSVQMQKLGFANVYEALRKMPLANGAVQDSQATANFTPGAQEISLFGLDPGFTLIMINGHPMADFPLMFNGMSNIVDLTNIPTGMVDRIDILPGNNSSIYGSSAIAGVVNIILKDRVEGFELNLRTGGYKGGGGGNQRLQFLGGHSWGQFDLTFGAELNNQQPIWGRQRALTRSTDANPDPSGRKACSMAPPRAITGRTTVISAAANMPTATTRSTTSTARRSPTPISNTSSTKKRRSTAISSTASAR